jgi:hypothetical protein
MDRLGLARRAKKDSQTAAVGDAEGMARWAPAEASKKPSRVGSCQWALRQR